MEADNNNPGWYYYSIAHNAKSESNNNKGQAQTTAEKMIKPGQTLLIFSNGTYTGTGYQPHRFTHHNDPGITLFNYEDREGCICTTLCLILTTEYMIRNLPL